MPANMEVSNCPDNPVPGPHVAGLVLARGGSQGIPLKNLAPLGPTGKPLLSWALDAMSAVSSSSSGRDDFSSLWVSTEHPAIAKCAQSHQGVKVFWRSPLHARSNSPSVDAVREFLDARAEVDVVCLVQCTSPLVRPQFLAQALALMRRGQYDSVFSVTRTKKFRWSQVGQDCPTTRPLNFDPCARPRRQDWRGEMVENGMFYLARRHLVEKGILQGGKCTYVEVPSDLSLEIDRPIDLTMAESVIVSIRNSQDGKKKQNLLDNSSPPALYEDNST